MPTKKTRSHRSAAEPAMEAPMMHSESSMSAPMEAESAYSLNNMLRFLNNNAGLLFIAIAIFVIGFMVGSIWTENNFLRKNGGSLAAGSTLQQGGTQQQAQPEAPQVLGDADWKAVQDNPAGVIGNPNAKLTMVEFTDYQCPFCERYFTDTYGTLKKDYIDTGKLKVILRDQPLPFHANSRIGAMAARCAGDQGVLPNIKARNFEAMHDALFANQSQWVDLAKDQAIAKFGELAKAAGMNGDELQSCVKNEKFGTAVDNDAALGSRVGANGTPTFFIEKQTLVGAQPTATFKAKIDALLK